MADTRPLIRGAVITALLVICCSCEKPIHMTDEQLHTKAAGLSLQPRYDLYLQIYKSSTPRNPLLADDIVKLGPPARRYVVRRALRDTGAELGAALTVLSEFNVGCSEHETTMLVKAVENSADSEGQRNALVNRVKSVCQRSAPAGWR